MQNGSLKITVFHLILLDDATAKYKVSHKAHSETSFSAGINVLHTIISNETWYVLVF